MLKNENLSSPKQMEKSTISFGNFFKNFIEAANDSGFPEISKKIAQWDMMKIMMSYIAIAEPMQCGFKVLNHGDSWCNNMMFKKGDDGTSTDMRFIDYQMSFWGGPSADLGYFFISSLSNDIKVEHFDNLLVFYHDELVKALQALNYEKHIPTLSELHVDMIEKGPSCKFFILIIKLRSDDTHGKYF